ncbi:hypothetical protein SSCG_02750 [Streptomyces clavuligerus]|nr:hypothetical protein SSCG_02750 [Streptomyces clavuligerus]
MAVGAGLPADPGRYAVRNSARSLRCAPPGRGAPARAPPSPFTSSGLFSAGTATVAESADQGIPSVSVGCNPRVGPLRNVQYRTNPIRTRAGRRHPEIEETCHVTGAADP